MHGRGMLDADRQTSQPGGQHAQLYVMVPMGAWNLYRLRIPDL